MRDSIEESLAEDTSTDPVVRRLLRKKALLQAAEELEREFRFEIQHPESNLNPASGSVSDDAAPAA